MSQPEPAPRRRGRAAWTWIALLLILAMGASYRLTNVNWDKGTYHIHPDERFTTMVVTAVTWPESVAAYFDTGDSPLNPRNNGMVYFYGTLPLFLTKAVAAGLDAAVQAYVSARPEVPMWAITWVPLSGYDRVHLVGRVLSALFDLGTVLLLFFFARRLFDWRVGLAASFLLALAVLDIQGSHYFAVDTYLSFFVLLTLWAMLDVAEGKGWPAFIGLGLAMGLTLACKVSVFLLVLVVVLAAWLRVRRQVAQGRPGGRASLAALGGLLLAAVVAFGIFRVAQPYAWAGPDYAGWDQVPEAFRPQLRLLEKIPEPLRALFMPNPRWIADILEAGGQQTGAADVPWGHQWAERKPWLWPLYNTVVWGMGVPFGAAACGGIVLALFLILRRWHRARRSQTIVHGPSSIVHRPSSTLLLPLAWVLLIFGWQGAQYVKSLRYFLPLYPCLALFAGWLVVWTWDWARVRSKRLRVAAGALGGVVLLGTFLWALAFIQIYRVPVTRVQATEWMYENIPPGSTIATEHYDDPLPFNMFGYNAYGGMYEGIELTNYWEDTPEKLEKLLGDLDQADYIAMSSGRLSTSIPRLPMRFPFTTRYYELLQAGELGFEKVAEFTSYPRLLGIEFNDDRAEEQFTVYDHPKVQVFRKTSAFDTETVRAQLTEGLDWDGIAHGLLARDVGKWKRDQRKLERALGGVQASQERKDLLLTEEQRRVQEEGGTWASIFRHDSFANRVPVLAWLLLLAALGLAALPLTIGLFQWLPDRGYILARPVGVLLLAWLSWVLTNLTPLTYSRGTIGLAFGLVVLASAATLALPAQRRRLADLWRGQKRMVLVTEGLFLAFFLLFLLIRWGNPDLWHPYKGGEKPMDFAFLNAVIKSTEFPPYDPWFAGGYLNYYYFGQVMAGTLIKLVGIVPSVAYNLALPAWFAMTAMGAFSAAHNLVSHPLPSRDRAGVRVVPGPRRLSPLLVGLAAALGVAVLGNLGEIALVVDGLGRGLLPEFKSSIPGLEGLVRAAVGLWQVISSGRTLPVGLDEWYWNASRAITSATYESVITEFPFFTFLYADLHAHLLAMPLTFLSLAAAISVVRRPAAGAARRERLRVLGALVALLVFWALVIGAMRTTNTWDVPPHLILALGALAIGEASRYRQEWGATAGTVPHPFRAWHPERSEGPLVAEGETLGCAQHDMPAGGPARARLLGPLGFVAWQFALLLMLGWWVLYRPFWQSYGAYYNSLGLWQGTRTSPGDYLIVHGLFLFAIVSYLLVRAFGRRLGTRPDPLVRRARLTLRYARRPRRLRRVAGIARARGVPVGRWLWLALALLLVVEVALLVPGLLPFTQAKADAEPGSYAYRGLGTWALGLPLALLGLSLLLRRRADPEERLWATLLLLGLAMSLGVEVLVLQGDIGRMNTVFKFYLQVWLLWGVAAAAALGYIAPHLRRWRWGRKLWLVVLGVLVFCAALYPVLGSAAKVRDRFFGRAGPGGLDGWAYMHTARYADYNQDFDLKWDYEAMRWMLDNIVGSPAIIEGYAGEYHWGARYAINTGLPAVIGWNWHERQQRAVAGDQQVMERMADVNFFYDTPFADDAQDVLDRYGVKYIIVGPMERAAYGAGSLAKFDGMVNDGRLARVYQSEGVTIYEVLGER
jgi:YYY domain-containing protein